MPNMPPVTHDASADTESGEASEVLSEPSEPSVDSTPPRMTLQLHAIGALGQRGTSPVKLDVHSSFPSGGFLLPFSDGDSSRTAISTRTSGRLTHGTARTDGTDTARTDGVDTARLDGTLTPRGTHVLLTRAEEKQYKWAIRRSDFKVNERLGAGAYGEVWAGSWRRNDVAVKLLTRGSGSGDADKGKQDFLREMQLLSELRHPNIVRFLGACLDMQHMCILFELCPRSLFDLLYKEPYTREELNEHYMLVVLREAASPPSRQLPPPSRHPPAPIPSPPPPPPLGGARHLLPPPLRASRAAPRPQVGERAPRRVGHRKGARGGRRPGLRAAEVSPRGPCTAQVCDFGLSHSMEDAANNFDPNERSGVGSPQWTAPEILRGGRYDEKADSYSFGVLLYEVLARQLPYVGQDTSTIIIGVITRMLERPALEPADAARWPARLPELMEECLREEPADRPDVEAPHVPRPSPPTRPSDTTPTHHRVTQSSPPRPHARVAHP